MSVFLKKNKLQRSAVLKAWKRHSKLLKDSSVNRERHLKQQMKAVTEMHNHILYQMEVNVSVLEEKIKDVSRNHEEEKKYLETELKAGTEKSNQIIDQLKCKVSALEEQIKEISLVHEEEKRCLKLELKEDAEKHNQILDQMKHKVECPVCMEVPRSGPVPVCPNGHFVCKKCKIGACPTCRVPMGSGMSLLACIVVDNIKHVCRFVNCEESFALDKIEDHEKICAHRIVSCPNDLCGEKFGLSNVLNHFQYSDPQCATKPKALIDDSLIDGSGSGVAKYVMNREALSKSESDWIMLTFSYNNKIFAVIPKKIDNYYFFTMVLFGSKEETLKYIIDMKVYAPGEDPEVSYRYRGKPISVDENMNEVRCLGLTVSNRGMEQILRKTDTDDFDFHVSFTVSEI